MASGESNLKMCHSNKTFHEHISNGFVYLKKENSILTFFFIGMEKVFLIFSWIRVRETAFCRLFYANFEIKSKK